MMLHSQKVGVGLLVALLATPAGASGSETAPRGAPASGLAAEPIPFVPFRLEEIVDPDTGAPARPGVPIEIAADRAVVYRGTPERLLQLLNGLEERANATGQSLRHSGNLQTAAFSDPFALRRQLLFDLGIDSEGAVAAVRPSLTSCPQLTLELLRRDSQARNVMRPDERLLINHDVYLTAADLVVRLNAQQDLFCTLGWDMVGEVSVRAPTTVAEVLARRHELMQTFEIPRYHRAFAMRPLTPLKPFGAITAEATAATAARGVPTVLDLRRLRGSIPPIPAFALPDLPAVPVVEQQPPRPLKVHKRKAWQGVNFGDTGTVAVRADGFYALDASETASRGEAMGQAAVYMAGHELRLAKAVALAEETAQDLHGLVTLEVLGHALVYTEDRHPTEAHLSSPEILSYEMHEGFTQRLAIGPIPVEFIEGVRGRAAVAIDMVVRHGEIGSQLTPKVEAQGFVSGAIGASEILAVGAGSSLTMLELTAPLEGRSRLELEDDTEPALVNQINVGIGYGALRGGMYVFAKLPVPRWGLPPWKITTLTHELFGWPGFEGRHRLIGWGQRLSASGLTLLGDLTDQDDMKEAEALQAAIFREQRERELTRQENAVSEREARVFAAIRADLGSGGAVAVVRDVRHVAQEHEAVEALFAPYTDNLADLLSALSRDTVN